MSFLLYVLLFLAAPYIADFYGIPLLSKVLRVQGIVLFINAFKMVQSNQLRKQFRFKPFAITNVVTSLVSLVITVVMAYIGFGVWALVSTLLFLAIYIGISKIMKIESYIYCSNIVKSVILKKILR